MKPLLTLIIAALLSSYSFADIEDWHWTRTEPDLVNLNWRTIEGVAKIQISGQKFVADMLYQDEKFYFSYHLEGHIEGKKLFATETHLYTDASPSKFEGTIHREPPSGGRGFEYIVLTNGSVSQGFIHRIQESQSKTNGMAP